MKDIVINIGKYSASTIAGLTFFVVAALAGIGITLMFFGDDLRNAQGIVTLPLAAVVLSFPIGALFGYQLLDSDKKNTARSVAVVGLLVPACTSLLAIFCTFGVFALLETVSQEMLSLRKIIEVIQALAVITLFSQMFVGWIIYPCGLLAAYLLKRLAGSELLSGSIRITLLEPRRETTSPRKNEETDEAETKEL